MNAFLRTTLATTFAVALVVAGCIATRAASVVPIAGSGIAGFRDGRALEARFLLPSALAYDARGDLYIADAAAQRIRVLGIDGNVRTLAGSGELDASGLAVRGGYADGEAARAKFRHPSGLAVTATGDVYVADTENHAIRMISHGRVTTYAGDPMAMGSADGPIASARFAFPHEIVFDGSTMYVADYGNGLRKIAGGIVSTVHTDFVEKRVTGLSIGTGKDGKRTLFVADLTGLSEIDLATGKLIKYRVDNADTQGFVDVGPPYALAAFGPEDVVYTDLEHDEVKALRGNNLQYITSPNADDIAFGAPTAGPRTDVHGPLGVAVRADGRIAIADGGRRRIVLAPAAAGVGILPDGFSDSLFAPDAYRIAMLSNSPIYWSQNDTNSVARYVQSGLARAKAGGKHGTATVFFRNTFPGLAVNISRDILSKGVVDCVVLVVNSSFLSIYRSGPSTSLLDFSELVADPVASKPYLADLATDLTKLRATLAAGNVKLVLVAMPFPWDLGPSTNLFATEDLHNLERQTWMQPPYFAGPPLAANARITDFTIVETRLTAALRATGAPVLDLWPTFRAVEGATPGVLYPTQDLHFSPMGRKIVGDAIARELIRIKPWAGP